jgi:hypothetical protein
MSDRPRRVYVFEHIEQSVPERPIAKYMPLCWFESLIATSALYFRRINEFKDDTEEGKIPLAAWNMNVQPFKDWFSRCRKEIFVDCWNLDEHETAKMWMDYANYHGVRIGSTVGALVGELSFPKLPEREPLDPKYDVMLRQPGVVEGEAEPPPHDSFTTGNIRYIDEANLDMHQTMLESMSIAVPAFRKLAGFVDEHEFRAILCSGAASGLAANESDHVLVPIRLQNLIHEIRFAPVDDPAVEKRVRDLAASAGLNIAIIPAALGVKMPSP